MTVNGVVEDIEFLAAASEFINSNNRKSRNQCYIFISSDEWGSDVDSSS